MERGKQKRAVIVNGATVNEGFGWITTHCRRLVCQEQRAAPFRFVDVFSMCLSVLFLQEDHVHINFGDPRIRDQKKVK